tara:strand:- start:119 stop:640 length:522 start_codon:yes stop_codon:yes gene_type:complete
MKKLEILLTDKHYDLLKRIAQADDRRLSDLIPLLFSTGLNFYFDEKNIFIEKKDNEFTNEEKKQNKINKELEINNPGFWGLSNDKRKKLGYKYVETFYSNYHSQQKNFISELSKDLKEYALQQIKQDFKEIEENIIKENTPKEDKIYSLVDGTNKKSIVNGNTWNESEVKNND